MSESTPSSLPQGDIKLRDGRRLAYAEYGDLKGKPVLFFHATPGSRLFHHPDESVAAAAGARIIVIDRPGFGRSDFKAGRKLLEWPGDVLQLADALNLSKFAVLGYSGGGAYAAACASSIPDRLTAVGLVGSIAPMEDPEMTRGMHGIGHIFLSLDRHLSPLAKLGTGVMCNIWRDNPDAYFKSQLDGLRDSEAARDLLPSIKTMLAADIREAIRCGTEGVTFDLKLLSQPWGFQMNVIKPEVLLWHGDTDAEAPVAMGKRLASAIPHCRAAFFPGEGHWAIYFHWREILTALLAAAGTRTVSSAVPLQDLTRTQPSISTLSDPSADSGQGLPPASNAAAPQAADAVPLEGPPAEAPTGTDPAEGKKLTLVEVIESLADAPLEVPVDETPAPADEAATPVAEAPTSSCDASVPMAEAPSPEAEAASPVAEPPAPVQEATEAVTEASPPVEKAPPRDSRKKGKAAPADEAPAPISKKKAPRRGKAGGRTVSIPGSPPSPAKKDRPATEKAKAAGKSSPRPASTGAKGRDSGDARAAKGKTAVPARKPAKPVAEAAATGAKREAPSAPKHEEPAPKKPASGRRSASEAVHV